MLPCISTAVVAPIVAPPAMNTFSQDNEISAPAEIARLFIKATVGTFESNIASLICVAASTRPPKVLTSNIIAFALFSSASAIERSMNGGNPKSIVPSIGM